MTSRLHALIDAELESSGGRLSSHNILLAGFGQGAALALHAGMSYSKPLAGIVSIAGYAPRPELYPGHVNPVQVKTPVLAIHGNSDFIIPIAFAKRRYETMRQAGVRVDLKTEWSMAHFVSNASLMGSQGWMTQALARADEEAKKK